MALIVIMNKDKKTFLHVQCKEPVTQFISHDFETSERQLLVTTIESCPGASMQLIHREHLPMQDDFGDECFDFVLELSQPNVLALSATGFEWSDDARSLVSGFPVDKEDVRQIQQTYSTRIRRERYMVGGLHNRSITGESILELKRLHRQRNAQLQVGAIISYTPDK